MRVLKLRDQRDMEVALSVQIERLPEGLYLATSAQMPGLVAQGRTIAEVLEIARDVARKLIEIRQEWDAHDLPPADLQHEFSIVVGV
jgi:predicted RNase H-like HicB family nuclease